MFIHMHSLLVTHRNDSGINDCVQSPGSKPCIDKRANTASDMRSKILQWYGGTERLAIGYGGEHMKGA